MAKAKEGKAVELYALIDPRTNEVRYIGKANNAANRLQTHLRDSRRRDTPVYRWIRKLGRLGLTPHITILETSNADAWKDVERRLIASHRAAGVRLLNVADGGDEPHCSSETRAKNARKVTAARPANVMRAYRLMESHIRFAKKHIPHKVEKYETALARFRECVAQCREVGRLEILNERLAPVVNKWGG